MNQEILITHTKDERSDTPIKLITNKARFIPAPGIEVVEAQGDLRHLIIQLLSYIEKASKKNNSSRGCPFLPSVVQNNGLYLSPLDEDPTKEGYDLSSIFQKLLADFRGVSPHKTKKGMPFDPTVLLNPFTDPHANSETFVRNLEKEHATQRSNFIEQGLMVGHMSPFHEGGESSLFHADIPFLSARRMSERDEVFMTSDRDKASFNAIYRSAATPSIDYDGWFEQILYGYFPPDFKNNTDR